ncbi:hypothetical protein LEP1GSC125_3989 [Leptospira mayottensis 200901122]|uniref:Uncharacterized protein n=1 Tax=Leptospira mayottensis 200901122 TaxID=1193010 RepID=A0AA87MTZ6_9LEPT|nr:hypothetical protein LEP1GSC125_3989 [Leptospira mayottensis 200901122]
MVFPFHSQKSNGFFNRFVLAREKPATTQITPIPLFVRFLPFV